MMKKRMVLLLSILTFLLSMTLELTAQTPDNGRWHHPLFLANNNYWKKRAVLTLESVNSYDGASIAFEIGQTGSQLNLAGVDAKSIRVCTEAGLEVAYACFSTDNKLVKTGDVKNGYQLVIPVECQANTPVKYYVYYNNASAGEVRQCCTYTYDENTITNGTSMIESITYDTLTLAKVGKKNPTFWYDDDPTDNKIWNYRVPIIVANLTDTPSSKLTIVNTARFENWKGAGINMDSLRIVDGETEIPYCQVDIYTSFYTTIPAKSYMYFHAYFSTDESIQPPVMIDYTELNAGNIVANPAFLQTHVVNNKTLPVDWTFSPADNPNITYGVGETGLFGSKSAYYTNNGTTWGDWKQSVPVEPASLYLFSCWTKLGPGSAGASQMIIFKTATGSDCLYKNYPVTPVRAIPGGDWTLSASAVSTPDDVQNAVIAMGTSKVNSAEFDGVLLTPVNYGEIDPMQINPVLQQATGPTQLWSVPTIEKVFPDNFPPQIITDVTACSARKERESMQLAMRSTIEGSYTVNLASLTHETENVQLTDIEINEILYVPIDAVTDALNTGYNLKNFHRNSAGTTTGMVTPQSLVPGNDGWIGLWPDPMKPCEGTIDLSADVTKSLIVTVTVPEGVPAGIYRGTLHLKQDTAVKASINIEFRVWGFEIPEDNHLITKFDIDNLSTTDPNDYLTKTVAQYLIQEGIIPSGLPIPEIRKRLHHYYPMMWEKCKKYRIEPNSPYPDPIFDYNNDTVDDASYDVATDLYFNTYKFQNMYSPDIFMLGLYSTVPWGIFGIKYHMADNVTVNPEYITMVQWLVNKYQTMITQKNLADKSWIYLWDEPNNDSIHYPGTSQAVATLSDAIHAADGSAKIYVSTLFYYPELVGKVDIHGIFPRSHHINRDEIQILQDSPTTELMYTMDGYYNLDTPYYGVERSLPYFCKTFNSLGFESWGADLVPSYNPFKWPWRWNKENAADRFSNGDGYLFYIGQLGNRIEILPTTRIDQIREGLEDSEYIHILDEFVKQGTGSPADLAEAQAILDIIDNEVNNNFYPNITFKETTPFIKDPGLFVRLKTRMGTLIEKINATPDNMLVNGDFTNDYTGWQTYTDWIANSTVFTTVNPEKSAQIRITNGGYYTYSIQLYQPGLTIEQNATYTVSFNAQASTSRSINAVVGMVGAPYTSYSNVETVNLTTDMQTYTFTFTMQNTTDTNARLEFELGTGSNVDITIDDVVLYKHN